VSGEAKKERAQAEEEPPALEEQESPADEESEGTLAPNPELEEALREAAAAVPDTDESDESEAPEQGDEESGPAVSGEDAQRLNDELAELEARNLRLLADYENFRKRALRERQEAARYGSQNLVKDLLSVVDNLDRAIGHARQSEGGDLQSLLQGVELVQREFTAVLAKHHVIEIEAQGKPFNPALHEAMAQIDSDTAEPNTIIDVLEKGYQLHDRLVRPSRVVVARGRDENAESEGGDDEENAG
jgi:molecular chaperone GrpE